MNVKHIIAAISLMCFVFVCHIIILNKLKSKSIEEIFGPDEVKHTIILKPEDVNKECLECHNDDKGMTLNDYAKKKYGR